MSSTFVTSCIVVSLSLGGGKLSSYEGEVSFSRHRDYKAKGRFGADAGARAVLKLNRRRYAHGETVVADVRVENTGQEKIPLYNPSFGALPVNPGVLALYDGKKRYLGDLKQSIHGSQTYGVSEDWTFSAADCYAGARIRFKAGERPGWGELVDGPLPPGTYFVQVIYSRSFLATPPRSNHERSEFEKGLRVELFRSNAVEFQVMPLQSPRKTLQRSREAVRKLIRLPRE